MYKILYNAKSKVKNVRLLRGDTKIPEGLYSPEEGWTILKKDTRKEALEWIYSFFKGENSKKKK